MVHLFCKLCLQPIPSIDWKTHITQKEHIQQLPLKILVKGHFQKDKIDDVYAYFGKFGGIRSQNVREEGDIFAIEYRFWDARVYCDVIHSEHTNLGDEVEISWYKKPKTGVLQLVVQDHKMENEKFTYRKLALIEALKAPPTFLDQLSVFQAHLKRIQDNLEETRRIIHADLTTALASTFPHNKLHFFGSSITNLDLPDSDLNIYLDSTDSSATTLDQIRNLITNGNFNDVCVVSKNDTPLVKFKHKTKKVSCELSIKNELPVGKSELVKFYQSLNEKVKDLMLVVKFWADCHGLRDQQGFSGYALNLMVIFYLQQEPYKLPSVYDLQKESLCDEIDGWNCAFGPVEFSDSLQNATILDLLVGFFQFYGNFDYGNRVVSVFSGSGIEKSRFIKPDDLPECFQDYLNQENVFVVNDGACIQDPFEHSKNVTLDVPLECPGKLAAACRTSLELALSDEIELFSKLLLFPPKNKVIVKNVEGTILKQLLLKILQDVCSCEFTTSCSNTETSYHATGKHNIWENRVQVSKKLIQEGHVIDYEAAITSLVKNSARSQSWSLDATVRIEPDSRAIVEFSADFSLLPHIVHFIYVTLMTSLADVSVDTIKTEVLFMEAEEIRPEEIKQENDEDDVILLDPICEKQPDDFNVVEKIEVIEVDNPQIKIEDENSETDPLKTLFLDDEGEKNMLGMAGTSGGDATDAWPDFETLKHVISGVKDIPTFEAQMVFFLSKLQENKPRIDDIRSDLISVIGTNEISFYSCPDVLKIYIEGNENGIKSLLSSSGKFASIESSKFVHVGTKTTCELDTNRIEARRRKLMEYYVSLDQKIQGLMSFVHLWMISHKFPDLADILVVFFLQQKPYKLPSVKQLQANAPSDLIGGWNCAFKKVEWQNQALQRATFSDLVHGFFSFYQKFDYTYVISPYCGFKLRKSRFLKPYKLPKSLGQCMGQDKILSANTNIKVQDPFDLSKNLCDVTPVNLDEFSVRCHESSRMEPSEIWASLLTTRSSEVDRLTYVVEKETGEDHEWIESVKNIVIIILEKVCNGEIYHVSTKRGCFKVKGHINVWNSRIRAKKNCKRVGTHLEREVAITKAVRTKFRELEEWDFTLYLKFFTDPAKVELSFQHSMKNMSTHFIYFHLVKALDERGHKAVVTTSTMDTVLKVVSGETSRNKETVALLHQLELRPESMEAIIIDLKWILDSSFVVRRIDLAPTFSKLDHLDIHIDCEEPSLEKMTSLISQSVGFVDVELKSQTITCRFLQTGLTCRVKLTKEDPNNENIRKFASVRKVRFLMMMVKFWADCHDLTGIGGFSTNAVYTLVIFFLQQSSSGSTPLFKLLGSFFEFYSNFDYISYVVSPHPGAPIKKVGFLEPHDLPVGFAAKSDVHIDSSLCILDFFNQSVGSFGCDFSGQFTALCRSSAWMLKKNETLLSILTKPVFNVCTLYIEPCKNSRRMVIKMAEKVLKEVFQCSVVASDDGTFSCSGVYNIWDKRIKVLKNASLPRDDMNREVMLSSLVVKDFPEKSPWTVSINFSFSEGNAKVEFVENSGLCAHLCHFMNIKLLRSIFGASEGDKSSDDETPSVSIAFDQKVDSFFEKPSEETLSLVKTDLSVLLSQKEYHTFVYGHTGLETNNIRVDVEDYNLNEIKRSLSSSSKFTDILMVDGNIEAVHCGSKMSVVFSAKDAMEIQRSALIQYYLSLDEKIYRLMIMVKTWTTHHDLQLPEFALAMVVIAYLQEEHKVPSVYKLQVETSQYLVNGWNCAFSKTDTTLLLSEMTLLELVEGFFKFYGDFDCFSNIISPFLGYQVQKVNFLQPFTLPAQYRTYKEKGYELPVDTGLCVQDPFDHTRNVAQKVSYQDACKFARFCNYSCSVVQAPDNNLMERLLVWDQKVHGRICEVTLYLDNTRTLEEWVQAVNDLFKSIVINVLAGEVEERGQTGYNRQYKCKCSDVFKDRTCALKTTLKTCSSKVGGLDREIAVTSNVTTEKIGLWTWGSQINFKRDFLGVTVRSEGNYAYVPCHFLYTKFPKFLKCEQNINSTLRIQTKGSPSVGVKRKRDKDPERSTKNKRRKTEKKGGNFRVAASSRIENLATATTQLINKANLVIKSMPKLRKTKTPPEKLPSPSKYLGVSLKRGQKNTKAVLKGMQKLESFEAQVFFILKKVFADRSRLSTCQTTIQEDLKSAVATHFIIQLHPCGSSVIDTFTAHSNFNFYVEILKTISPVKFDEVQQLLLQSGHFDAVFWPTPNIVTCRHKKFNLMCVLHFTHKIHAYTTRLIAYYLSLDRKVRPLLCLIKTWVAQNPVLKKVVSSYAVCIMMIFYLQQQPYCLPSVARLQTNEKILGGWNVAFTPIKFKSEALEKVKLKDLLFGFFKFYARFDFYLYVIAPFSGKAMKKTSSDLPESMQLTSFICIQDFFIHDRNLTPATNLISFEKFTKKLKNALQFVYFSDKELIFNLLTQCDSGNFVESSGFLVPKEKSWNKDQWICGTKNVALTILTKMMGCSDVITDEKTVPADLKGGKKRLPRVYRNIENFPKDKVTEITISCRSPSELIWNNRVNISKQIEKDIPPGTSDFDADIAVSTHMFKNAKEQSTQSLGVVLTFVELLGMVKVEFKSRKGCHLGHFFSVRLLQGLRKELSTRSVPLPPPSNVLGPPYKILVSLAGFSEHQKLLDYFASFGEISNSSVLSSNQTVAVEFTFVEQAEYLKVIQRDHFILGKKVKLVPLAPMNLCEHYAKFEDPLLENIHGVITQQSFEQQVETLWKSRNIHKKSVERQQEIVCDDLNAVLSSQIPGKTVYPEFQTEYYSLGSLMELLIDVEPKELVNVKKAISESANFENVEITASTKSLYLKTVHVETRINCKLRLGQNLEFYRLLKHYLSLDPKIEKLLMLVTFWMNCHDLLGPRSFSKKMTYIMVIFFLQQQPYSLSPLFPKFCSPSLQEATIMEMVSAFFKFYANFDYISYVICPYFGAALEKTRFLEPYNLPECFSNYVCENKPFVTSGLCLQDVFQHSDNLAQLIPLDMAGLFSHLCRCSLETMQSGEPLLLYRLLLYNQDRILRFPDFVLKKPQEDNQQEWVRKVKTTTMEVLTKVLDFNWSQISDFDSRRVSFACVSRSDIWKHRIQAAKQVENFNIGGILKEIAITKTADKEEATRNLFVQLVFSEGEVKVVFVKKPKSCDVFHTCHFLYTRLKRFLEDASQTEVAEVIEDGTTTSKPPTQSNLSDEVAEQRNGDTNEVVTILDSEDEISSKSQSLSEERENNEDVNDDDVPSDFFDDFANEDFLEGLDIVDTWTNDKDTESKKPSTPRTRQRRRRQRSRSPSRERRREKRRSHSRRRRRSRKSSNKSRSTSVTRKKRSASRSRSRSPQDIKRRKEVYEQQVRQKINEHQVLWKINEVAVPPACVRVPISACGPVPKSNCAPPIIYEVPYTSMASAIVPHLPPSEGLLPDSPMLIPLPVPPPAVVVPEPEPEEDPAKLFAERKITLSEFLRITSQREAVAKKAVWQSIQHKVKVISRCQNILNFLTYGSNEMGKFVVNSSPKPFTQIQHQSPLKRKHVLRFQFTSASNYVRAEAVFECLSTLLRRAGIPGELKTDEDEGTKSDDLNL